MREGANSLPAGPLSVAFRDVCFGYEARRRAGARWALLPPGAGPGAGPPGPDRQRKDARWLACCFVSTTPQVGTVALGGVDLRHAGLAELRQRVGVVTQEVQLFHATIRDNLTLFDPTIPDERIHAAIDALGLRGWADVLPEGLDTAPGRGGGGLSAGEAQLLAFTRIFLRDPGLVILDEASSRLDPATEQLIERAVGRLLRGRTGIIIAHRLQTITWADEILILEDGRVVEHGERRRLLQEPGSRFSRLLRTGADRPPGGGPGMSTWRYLLHLLRFRAGLWGCGLPGDDRPHAAQHGAGAAGPGVSQRADGQGPGPLRSAGRSSSCWSWPRSRASSRT